MTYNGPPLPHLRSFQKQPPDESLGSQQPVQKLHLPIPPIVVNPVKCEPLYYPHKHYRVNANTLVHGVNPIANINGINPPVNPGAHLGFPPANVVLPSPYIRYPVYGNPYHVPHTQLLYKDNVRPPPAEIQSHYTPPRVNYKPPHIKRNLHPKINVIVNECKARKLAREEMAEPSADDVYLDFRTVMRIDVPRSPVSVLEFVVADDMEKQLFGLFVTRLAQLIDVYMPMDIFRKIVPEIALADSTGMVLSLMFCLSLLFMQRGRPDAIDPLRPLKYYQRTVNSIRSHLIAPDTADGMLPRCLLSTCLLCMYELFFQAMDTTYVKGAMSIFVSILSKSNTCLLRDSPFYEVCFWLVYFCDLVLSLKYQMPSMYSVDRVWRTLQPEYFADWDRVDATKDSLAMVTRQTTIWWQRRILLLYGSIVEFLYLSDVTTYADYNANTRLIQWQELSRRLDEYERDMPVFLMPLVSEPCSDTRVFPLMLFKDEYTVVTAIHVRLLRLALIEALHTNVHVADTHTLGVGQAKHPQHLCEKLAKEILGILQTYEYNQEVWPTSLHTLRKASNSIQKGTKAHDELKILARKMNRFSYMNQHLPVLHDG